MLAVKVLCLLKRAFAAFDDTKLTPGNTFFKDKIPKKSSYFE